MDDLTDFEQALEDNFGLIGGGMLWGLHAICERAGSKWILDKPETMEIVVNSENADSIYDWCRGIQAGIRAGYKIDLGKNGKKIVKEARRQAHEFLFDEANNPNTPIERKIELVRLTSK